MEIKNEEKIKTKQKFEEKKTMVELVVNAVDERLKLLLQTIMDANELAGCISNPKLGQEILNRKQLEKDREEIKDEDFEDIWNEMREFIPKSFSIIDDDLEGDDMGIDLERFNEYIADEIEKEDDKGR